jgi:hypothetical protein
VDLEVVGKRERQGHLNTVISGHTLEDIRAIRNVVDRSELLVRVNPLGDDTRVEVDEAIGRGADILMLPMFTTAGEVEAFVSAVAGRARVCLLLETPQAVVRLDDILQVGGIDEIHVGLNDLYLAMKLGFMFELLSGGIVEFVCHKIAAAGITYGFGGIARIGHGLLPAELVVAEHYRLGSSMAILSRSFCDANKLPAAEVAPIFRAGVSDIRAFETKVASYSERDFHDNTSLVREGVRRVLHALA